MEGSEIALNVAYICTASAGARFMSEQPNPCGTIRKVTQAPLGRVAYYNARRRSLTENIYTMLLCEFAHIRAPTVLQNSQHGRIKKHQHSTKPVFISVCDGGSSSSSGNDSFSLRPLFSSLSFTSSTPTNFIDIVSSNTTDIINSIHIIIIIIKNNF